MLRSCPYCGRIHEKSYTCPQKQQRIAERQRKGGDRETKFRYTKAWKEKREEIRERDSYCCQLCIRGLYDPERKYETEDLSVHHIIPIAEDWDSRLDNDNLITLCRKHHEQAEASSIPRDELRGIAEEQEEGNDFPAIG